MYTSESLSQLDLICWMQNIQPEIHRNHDDTWMLLRAASNETGRQDVVLGRGQIPCLVLVCGSNTLGASPKMNCSLLLKLLCSLITIEGSWDYSRGLLALTSILAQLTMPPPIDAKEVYCKVLVPCETP
jgi:hypothetical protein